MILREFRREDGDAVRAFWLVCGIPIRPGDDDDGLERFASRDRELFVLAEQDGHLLGTALAGWDGRRGWLYHVAVHPDERRRGLGRLMVRTLEERLAVRGCAKVNLLVWAENTRAFPFWEALGYVRAATVEYEKELE